MRPVWPFKILKRQSGAGAPEGASSVGKPSGDIVPGARGPEGLRTEAAESGQPAETAKIITKIAPSIGQSTEQFSYTHCLVFCTAFYIAKTSIMLRVVPVAFADPM